MSVYTQLHQITDAMGRNIDLDPMINDCIAGMQERDRQNEETVRTESEARAEIEAAIKAKAQELRRESLRTEYWSRHEHLETVAVDFTTGMKVKAGQLTPVRYDGKLYDVVQSHTTQSDWTPDTVPALFSVISEPGGSGYPVWRQPSGGHDAYDTGEKVEWPEGGKVWQSTIDANTTEPGTLTEHGYWTEVQ